MRRCARPGCLMRIYRDSSKGRPLVYCSVRCRNTVNSRKQRGSYHASDPAETARIEARLAAIDAEKRRTTPKFGWLR